MFMLKIMLPCFVYQFLVAFDKMSKEVLHWERFPRRKMNYELLRELQLQHFASSTCAVQHFDFDSVFKTCLQQFDNLSSSFGKCTKYCQLVVWQTCTPKDAFPSSPMFVWILGTRETPSALAIATSRPKGSRIWHPKARYWYFSVDSPRCNWNSRVTFSIWVQYVHGEGPKSISPRHGKVEMDQSLEISCSIEITSPSLIFGLDWKQRPKIREVI
jgi:hypothetical protein